jgi:DNA-binding CsgD family transcriptional regulator
MHKWTLRVLADAEHRPHAVAGRVERGLPDTDGIRPLNISPIFRGCATRAGDGRLRASEPMEEARMPQTAFLKNRFGLTPAEARVVLRLVSGDSLRLAAKALGIKYETVRTHLKSIFQKTGTRRQAELVIVVIRSLSELR